MHKRLYVLFFALLVALSACAFQPMIQVNPANPMYTVAVLPPYNASNDIDGPEMVRNLVQGRLANWHYSAKPLEEVDQILRDQMGITLGEQLELTTAQKLGETLGVDGVLYIYILNFDDKTTGVYNVKKVRAGLKLVDAKTGQTVWSMGQGVKSELTSGAIGSAASAVASMQEKKEGLEEFQSIKGISGIPNLTSWHLLGQQQENDIVKAGLMSLGTKVLSKAMKSHLKPESEAMLNMIFTTFPSGPGAPGGSGVAYAATPPPAMPDVPMPMIEAPGSAFIEFARLGKRDFTSDLVMTFSSKAEKEEVVMYGKVAKGGDNFRTDMDMSSLVKERGGKDAPAGIWKSAHITRMGERKIYTVYPDMKKYMERGVIEGEAKGPRIDKQKVGEEVIDGHRTDKFKVTITAQDGTVSTGFFWEAKDLDRFVIKVQFESKDGKGVLEFKNVRLVTPPAALFQVPQDYARASTFMELMMDQGHEGGREGGGGRRR